jgi:hypothetical protein
VVATGSLRKVGGHGQDLGTGQRERPVELGEAQVVADRQAEHHAVDGGTNEAIAGRHPGRLGVAGSGVDGHVEEMDLSVDGGDRPVGGEQGGAVERPRLIRRGLRGAADQDPRFAASRDLGEWVRVRPRDRSGRRAEAVVGASVLEVLREHDETGSA